MSTLAISVVVPIYNSGACLEELIGRLVPTLASLTAAFEIVLVNDGSSDDSWSRIARLAETDRRLVGLNLARNYGQHTALLTGVLAASQKVIVTLDDDLEQPPEEIPTLLRKMDEGFDLVYGSPKALTGEAGRNLLSRLVRRILSPLIPSPTIGTPFRAFRAELRERFGGARGPFLMLDVLLRWSARRMAIVPVTYHPTRKRRSGYQWSKRAMLTMNGITGLSLRPLQLASLLGSVSLALSVALFAAWVLRNHGFGANLDPCLLLSCLLGFFGGQSLLIGILGEYIGRIYFNSMGFSPILVESRINSPP